MDRLRLATAACVAAVAFAAGGTARADDGVPVAPGASTAVETAIAIAGQATDAANPGQYQADTGQYQGPTGNINVSVRVLSPGDDGAIDQAISVAQPAPATAPATAAPAAPVTISVNVNITNNWHIVFSPRSDTGQYHLPIDLPQNPASDVAGTVTAPAPEQPPAPATAAAPAPARVDDWGARPAARPLAAVARPHTTFRRGTHHPHHHHRRTGAGTAARHAPVPAPAAIPRPPTSGTAWPATHAVTRVAASHDGGERRPRPALPPAPRRPPATPPEEYAGAAAAGGSSLTSVLQTLGLLLASLWIAALGPARRLGDHVRRLRGVVGPRPQKPG